MVDIKNAFIQLQETRHGKKNKNNNDNSSVYLKKEKKRKNHVMRTYVVKG